MASAEAKLTGKLAVCITHSGPGTANIINGIADAASDRVPLLLLSGQVPTYNIGTNYKQYINQLELTNPLTVFSSQITNPESVIDLLYKAMTTAISRGGVSHLSIPMDLWEMETNALSRKFPDHLKQKQIPEKKLLDKVKQKINKSAKPAMVLGEFLTATRYSLPIRIIVMNNGALAMKKNKMITARLEQKGVDITNPDFTKLAQACDLKNTVIKDIKELQKTLQETRNLNEPILIDIPTADYIPQGTKLI